MLSWALILLIVAIASEIVGFGLLVGLTANLAILLFWVALAACVTLFIVGMVGGSSRPLP